MKKYYNQKRLKGLTFSERSMVYLAIKNIITKRFSKKLDYKYLGLYKVIKRILKNNYRLDISLLKDAINVELISAGRNNVKVNEKEYEAEKVFNIRNY